MMTNLSPVEGAARLGNDHEPPPAARLARLFSSELVGEAQALFAKRMQREISESEARVLLANLTSFIRLLASAD